MVNTCIDQSRGISNTTYHNRCSGRQRYWWLRGDGGFVQIGEHRGDDDLHIEVDLEPGEYTLGCGPQGKFGFRTTITAGD